MALLFQPPARPVEDERKDIFAPVADLLVGVVFIFLLLMLALSLYLQPELSVTVLQAEEIRRLEAALKESEAQKAALQQQLQELQTERDALKAAEAARERLQQELTALRVDRWRFRLRLDQERRGWLQERQQLLGRAEALQRDLVQATERVAAEQRNTAKAEAISAELRAMALWLRDSGVLELLQRLSSVDDGRAALLQAVQSRLKAQQIEAIANEAAGTLALPAARLFNSGMAEPTAEGRAVILALGDALQAALSCSAGPGPPGNPASCAAQSRFLTLASLTLEGHTDIVPLSGRGRHADNWDLSAARAIAAWRLIAERHPSLAELRNGDGQALIGVTGYGSSRPSARGLSSNRASVEIRDADRRIELRLSLGADRDAVGQLLRDLRQRLQALNVSE